MMFKAKGTLKGKGNTPFSWQAEAKSKNLFVNMLYSFFGNTYRLRRNQIIVSEVAEVESKPVKGAKKKKELKK